MGPPCAVSVRGHGLLEALVRLSWLIAVSGWMRTVNHQFRLLKLLASDWRDRAMAEDMWTHCGGHGWRGRWAQLCRENRYKLPILLCHCCVPWRLLWTRVSWHSVYVGDL